MAALLRENQPRIPRSTVRTCSVWLLLTEQACQNRAWYVDPRSGQPLCGQHIPEPVRKAAVA